jgi:cation transport ATPase
LVYGGTRVVEGTLQVRSEKVEEETYLSRTASLVEDSLARRGEVEKRADILASRLTRVGIALGMSGFLAPVTAGAFHVAHTAGIMLNSGRLLGWEGGSRRVERDA